MTMQRMTLENGDMYSTAFQFYSHIQASVDPRTGMYTASLDLTTGAGNRLRGPHFRLRLAYSPLSNIDDGFGTGWRLSVTEFDAQALMLSLATGDTHKIGPFTDLGPVSFPDRKLDSCSLRITQLSPVRAEVEHITGEIETLAPPRGIGEVLRTHRIIQSNGDGLTLHWEVTGAGYTCLTKVTDDDGVELLTVDYTAIASPKILIHSHQADPLVIACILEGRQLARIAIPTLTQMNRQSRAHDGENPDADEADEAVWQFTYERPDNGLVLLSSVTTPDGVRESVSYQRTALRLPAGAPRQYMPAVAESIRSDASSGAVRQRSTFRYDLFGQNNFYGYPVVGRWASSTDQLIHLPFDRSFFYGCVETRTTGQGEAAVVQVVERTYNPFHLITREETRRGTVIERIDTQYGIESVPFEEQPTTFQLPRVVTTTRYESRSGEPDGPRQITTVENTYDDMGNLLSRYDTATGITERSTYYPAEGETVDGIAACPPDPQAKVRRLKSRQIDPGQGRGPIRSTQYRYGAIRSIHASSAHDYYVQSCEEAIVMDGARVLERTVQAFVDDRGPHHGSLLRESRTQDGLTDTHDYRYTLDADAGTVTTLTTQTTHDGIRNSSSVTVHLVSGLTESNRDLAGNRTAYRYDLLGRMVSEVASPDDPDYRVETRWDYLLEAGRRWVQRTGVTGLRHRTWLDEYGHRTRQEEPVSAVALAPVEDAVHDAMGQVLSETRRDYLPDGLERAWTTRYTYDDWGQACVVEAPDGSRTLTGTSLLSDASLYGDEVISRTLQWQEHGDGTRTGWTETHTDAAGRKRLARRGTWNPDGTPNAMPATRWDYDGLGRCIAVTDPLGRVTRQTWDDYDRLATTQLPDGTTVVREYAPGQADELIATLNVLPPDGAPALALGKRAWDGLGRLLREDAGSLVTRHEYRPDQANASAKTMPGGGRIEMTYDNRLQEVLLSATLRGTGERADANLRTARYDRRLGLPSTVETSGHVMDIRTDYLGRMTEQDVTIQGDVRRTSKVEVSPAGRELTKTGVDGVSRQIGYDALGRMDYIDDRDVRITLGYDAFSRLERRDTLATDGSARRVIERRDYDPLGRIAAHAWQHLASDGSVDGRRMAIEWTDDDKVRSKTWYDASEGGRQVRHETMDYDARGRLVDHAIEASAQDELPRDERDAPYTRQTFAHDCIDNLVEVTTELADGRVNVTRYTYDAVDRDRLIGVSNSLTGYPGYGTALTLRYDANGNLVDDGMGRLLSWDAAGRLASVTLADGSTVDYGHGPDGLVSRIVRDGITTFRYREDGAVSYETSSTDQRRYIRTQGGIVAETLIAGAIRRSWLLGVDPQGSVVIEAAGNG